MPAALEGERVRPAVHSGPAGLLGPPNQSALPEVPPNATNTSVTPKQQSCTGGGKGKGLSPRLADHVTPPAPETQAKAKAPSLPDKKMPYSVELRPAMKRHADEGSNAAAGKSSPRGIPGEALPAQEPWVSMENTGTW